MDTLARLPFALAFTPRETLSEEGSAHFTTVAIAGTLDRETAVSYLVTLAVDAEVALDDHPRALSSTWAPSFDNLINLKGQGSPPTGISSPMGQHP